MTNRTNLIESSSEGPQLVLVEGLYPEDVVGDVQVIEQVAVVCVVEDSMHLQKTG